MSATTILKPLRSLEAGDIVLGINELKLTGPRGGKYVFRGMTASLPGGTAKPMVFTHSTLERNGIDRTFHFESGRPLTVNSKLSCKLRARVQVQS